MGVAEGEKALIIHFDSEGKTVEEFIEDMHKMFGFDRVVYCKHGKVEYMIRYQLGKAPERLDEESDKSLKGIEVAYSLEKERNGWFNIHSFEYRLTVENEKTHKEAKHMVEVREEDELIMNHRGYLMGALEEKGYAIKWDA